MEPRRAAATVLERPRHRAAAVLVPLLLIAAAFAAYLPALPGEFAVDDYRFVVWNAENLARLDRPWTFFTEPGTNADVADGDIYRPLRTLSFALDHAWSGDDPTGYHVHSVLLHALVGILAWRLFRPLLGAGAALFGALAFVVHPLATEAVAWISSRADLHAGVLVLLALLAARRSEARPRWLAATLLLGFLCGLGKETAVVVPALYLLEHRLRAGRWLRGAALPLGALGAGVAGYLVLYLAVTGRGITGQVGFYEGSFGAHLPYAVLGIARQLRLAVWPAGLHFMWEPNLFRPVTATAVVLAAAGLCAAATVAVLAWRRRPAVTIGLAWWLVALFPAANVVLPLRTVLAERFAYVPLLGLMLAAAALGAALQPRLARLGPAAPAAAAAVLLALLGGRTAGRAADWRSPETLYRATIEDHPATYAAWYGLAGLELAAGRTAAAEADFARARELAGDDPVRALDAAVGVAEARARQGDSAGAVAVLEPLAERLRADVELRARARNAAEARFLLAVALTRLSRLGDAERVLEGLLADHGETPSRLAALADVLQARHDVRALSYYSRALELDPDYHPARVRRAELLARIPGYQGEARRQLREVLFRDPGNPAAAALLQRLDAAEAPP